LEVGRFLYNAAAGQNVDNSTNSSSNKYAEIIHNECLGVVSIPHLRVCVLLLVVCSCCFYTPFLFDTLGDAVGVERSFWVFIVFCTVPLVLYGSRAVHQALVQSYSNKQAAVSQPRECSGDRDIELQPATASPSSVESAQSLKGAETKNPLVTVTLEK
jgi:hypothetical protein